MVRFDKPCCRVSGAVEYFREHMEIGDYLDQGGQAELTWFGRGADRLNLRGACRREYFERLCEGRHPLTGERLTARDKGVSRRVCFFGQISPPKDVSIACLVGGDERIRAWWNEAIRDTLREIEAVTATRVRRAGADEDRPTGNMVAAIVTHEASRKLDPQLHTHVCIMNATFDVAENRWKSVQPAGYYRHQAFFREVCYAKLAARLCAAGYELESVRGQGFILKGVPLELRERFSRRRAEIKRAAVMQGVTSQDALQTIAGESRDAKVNATAAGLRASWLKAAGDELVALHDVIDRADGKSRPKPTGTPETILADAEAHLFERRSVVDQRELLAQGLAGGRGDVSLTELRRELDRRVDSGALLRSGELVTSREALQAEEEFVSWANRTRQECPLLGTVSGAQGQFNRDQEAAIAAVLGSPSRVIVLQGDAGTGKTTCLRAIVAGIERQGGQTFGCAPSAGAADVLRRELTPMADTLQQLLVNARLQTALRGRVLVVDEAGLVSVRQMRDLCRLAAANDNRLLLVGDTKQHTSVEAGDALRCLQRYARVPVARLTEIRRQQDPAYREAVRLLARGNVLGAFKRLTELGAVRELADSRALFRTAADDYLRTLKAGKSCLAISPVWADIQAFNAEVRAQMRRAGLLRSAERAVPTVVSWQWTRAQRRRLSNYQPGDVLTFHRDLAGFVRNEHAAVVRKEGGRLILRGMSGREGSFDPRRAGGFDVGRSEEIPVSAGDRLLLRANVKSAALKNGDIVEVAGFATDGALRLAGGATLPAGYRHFTHGYSTTSHSAQGKTVDRGLLLLTEAGLGTANLKQCYVSNSRFRETQTIYTTDAKAARAAMQRPADRLLASELRAPAGRSSFRTALLHRLSRMRMVASALTVLRGWRDTYWGASPAMPVRT
ncbi:MAG: relaxase domain-containing protein [Opitutaceae bacterium]|nr:relaxase domain-containing protein [Opitutaceae bacterium]